MFERIRTIKGNRYRYREERYREGGKVRSRSTYLGKAEDDSGGVLGWIKQQIKPEPGMYLGMKMQAENEKYLAKQAAKENAPTKGEGDEPTPSSESEGHST